MTDAYIQGFCKTAEAYGVDPEQLMKVARINPGLLPKNIKATLLRASKVAPNEAAASRNLPFRERLHFLAKRMKKRFDAIDSSHHELWEGYPQGMPQSLKDAWKASARDVENSGAWQKLRKLLSKPVNE